MIMKLANSLHISTDDFIGIYEMDVDNDDYIIASAKSCRSSLVLH